MICATIAVAAGCMFACEGSAAEFQEAWQPTYSNELQMMVDQHGAPWPKLHQVTGSSVLWAVEADAATCAPVPKLKPIEGTP